MKNSAFFFLVIITFLTACGGQEKKNETENNLAVDISLKLEVITEGLHSPVAAAFSPGGLMLVCEQTGQIRVIENNKLIEQAFLNLESKLVKMSGAYDERGLLGIALHPDYAKNKKFYVYYSAPSTEKGLDHQSVIAEYKGLHINYQFLKSMLSLAFKFHSEKERICSIISMQQS